MRKSSVLLFPLLLLFALPSLAQDLSGFTRKLVPIYAPNGINGVGDSFFQTEVTAYAGAPCRFWPADPRYTRGDAFGTMQPGFGGVFSLLDRGVAARPQARFVFFDSRCADQVLIGLTVVSRFSKILSHANVPVVSERAFVTGDLWLMNMPNVITGDFILSDNRRSMYRHKLRVYDADGSGAGVVDVEMRGGADRQLTAQYRVTLDRRDGDDPSFPFYGEVEIEDFCYHITGNGCIWSEAAVHLSPASPGLRYWGFLTSTDNTTGHIVVTLPQ